MKIKKKFLRLIVPALWLLPATIWLLSACAPKNNAEDTSDTPPADSAANQYVKTAAEWTKNANIYEVNIRQYTEKGTFNAFLEHLPRLEQMGVDILWIMPIHPIGEKNRKGTLGSYYSIKDYKGVNPEFGTLDDFKRLVQEAHNAGMYVIIDWVANHSSWDNPWIEEHPEWYTQNEEGEIIMPPETDWSDVADLNYDNAEMRAAMKEALKYWVSETDIDGYRCDVAGMVPLEFWMEIREELDSIKPVFMLAEWNTPDIHEAFDMSYSWDFHHLMNEIAKGNQTALAIDSFFTAEANQYPPEAYRMQFTSNHDENSWNGHVFERMGDAAGTFAVLSATVPGMPLIYSGQEAGLDKRLDFFEKDLIEWKTHKFTDMYTKLLHLKERNKALWNGEYGGNLQKIASSDDAAIYAFMREKDGDKVVAVFNLGPKARKVTLNEGDYAGDYTEVFEKQRVTLSENQEFDLQPWEYKVFSNK